MVRPASSDKWRAPSVVRSGRRDCERFESKGHFISELSMIVRVNVVLNRTVVVDSNSGFAVILRVKVSCRYQTLLIDVIGQLSRDSIGRLSVKPL